MELTAVRELNAQVQKEALFIQDLLVEINKVMVGQESLVERVLVGLLADGHILLEGVPRSGQNALNQDSSGCHRCRFFTHSIHTRFAPR